MSKDCGSLNRHLLTISYKVPTTKLWGSRKEVASPRWLASRGAGKPAAADGWERVYEGVCVKQCKLRGTGRMQKWGRFTQATCDILCQLPVDNFVCRKLTRKVEKAVHMTVGHHEPVTKRPNHNNNVTMGGGWNG